MIEVSDNGLLAGACGAEDIGPLVTGFTGPAVTGGVESGLAVERPVQQAAR